VSTARHTNQLGQRARFERDAWLRQPPLPKALGCQMIRQTFILAWVFSLLASSGTAAASGPGLGAHPINDRIATVWFVKSKNESKKELAALIYMVGVPGWTNQTVDFSAPMDDETATWNFKIDGSEFTASYNAATERLSVHGYDEPVTAANVLIIEGLGTNSLTIIHTELAKLEFEAHANPAIVFLQSSASIASKLGLQ